MSADIKLGENNVAVEATDLLLDHPSRRKVAGGQRRALVHDFDDGLTLNWANDYPGGVTIIGKAAVETIAPKGIALRIETADLQLNRADRRKNSTTERRALVHDFNDGLTLNWNKDYPGGVTIRGSVTLEDAHATSVEATHFISTDIKTTSIQVGSVQIHNGASDAGTGVAPLTHKHKLHIYADTIVAETTSTLTITGSAPTTTTLDLVAEIKALRAEVNALKAKVSALEGSG